MPTVAGRSGTPGDREQDSAIRLRVAERANDNAPSADRIVCHCRAGKCRAATSVRILDGRQPTEREVEAAAMGGPATKQGGVSIRIASSRSNRRTWPAHCLRCQFGLACLVSAGRRADAATLGRPRQGSLVPTSAGPPAVAAECWGAVTPSEEPPVRPGARALVSGAPAGILGR